jgi:hypothetical protein
MAMTDDWGGESSTRMQESVRPRQREFEEVLEKFRGGLIGH